MSEWVAIKDDGFIVADIIRWQEGIYKPQKSKKAKPVRLGNRLITAEVTQEPDAKGWTLLIVLLCEILSNLSIRKLALIASGAEIRRARKTIMRGKPERLLWSDESARALVASKFLDNRDDG